MPLRKCFQPVVTNTVPAIHDEMPAILGESLEIKKKSFLILAALAIAAAKDHCAGRLTVFPRVAVHGKLDRVVDGLMLASGSARDRLNVRATLS